jgi:hypothetical protein
VSLDVLVLGGTGDAVLIRHESSFIVVSCRSTNKTAREADFFPPSSHW